MATGVPLHRISPYESHFCAVESVRPPKAVEGDAYAIEEWNRVLPHLAETGVLTQVSLASLVAYAMSYADWMHAEDDV